MTHERGAALTSSGRATADRRTTPGMPFPTWRALGLAGALVLAACTSGAGGDRAMPLSPVVERAIEDSARMLLAQFRRLGAAARWDSLAGLYDDAPNFSWIESGRVVARSRADIRRGFDKLSPPLSPQLSLATTFDSLEVHALAAGVAFVQTRTTTQFIDKSSSGAPAFSFMTTMTMLIVRRADGWKIRHGHASGPPNGAH